MESKKTYLIGAFSSVLVSATSILVAICFISEGKGVFLVTGIILMVITVFFCISTWFVYCSLFLVFKIYRLLMSGNESETELIDRFQYKFLLRIIKKISDVRYQNTAREQESALAQKNIEFSVLQNQINPHFLYNTLESIRSEAIEQNVPEIAKMVKILSSYYRYSIDAHNHIVTFKEELQNLENYFLIQQFRFGNKISLRIDVAPEDECCYQFSVLKMTLQPIAENAIFHGLETKIGGGTLTISAEVTERVFIITISDNGIGMSLEKLNEINEGLSRSETTPKTDSKSHGTGMALLNVNKRIKLFFGEEYGIILRSIQGIGTDVEMTLPTETFKINRKGNGLK